MLRALRLPVDFRIGVDLIMRGFAQGHADKKEVAVDSLRTLRYLWPLYRLGALFSPALRDYFCGFIWEEDAQPVGFVMFSREDRTRWEIGIIVVLPEYRRRGIARSMMQASLDFIRARGGEVVVLDAAGDSEAACLLYERLGFERVFSAIEFNLEQHLTKRWPLPEGYEIIDQPPSDWRTKYELELRAAPAHIAHYDPIVESRYRTPGAVKVFQALLWKLSGQKESQIAIRSVGGAVVAWGKYLARLRPGGVNYATLRVDPQHPQVAIGLESALFYSLQRISPGRRIMFSVPDWQAGLIQASIDIGCVERNRYHHMGLCLQPGEGTRKTGVV